MKTFLRQMLALPVTICGFWMTSVGDILTEIAAKIEGRP
jgi:hypothetical protein